MLISERNRSGVGSAEMTEAERRGADVVKRGIVQEADYAGARVRVLVGDADDEEGHLLTGWLPMPGTRAGGDVDWHPLEVGERVIVLSEAGELQNGVVIPAGIYTSDNPAPGAKAGLWRKRFQDGATIEYDRDSGEFLIDAMTMATVRVDSAALEVKAGEITISVGAVSLKVTSSGVSIAGGTVTHDGVNIGKTHKHGNVVAGSALSGVAQ